MGKIFLKGFLRASSPSNNFAMGVAAEAATNGTTVAQRNMTFFADSSLTPVVFVGKACGAIFCEAVSVTIDLFAHEINLDGFID